MSTELSPFDSLQTNITILVGPVKDIKVTSKELSAAAAETFRALKKLEKSVEEKRVELVRPHNNHVDKINEFAKQVKAPILAAQEHVKKQQLAFEVILEKERQAQYAIEREEQRKRQEEAQAQIKAQQEEAAAKIAAMKEEAEMEAMFAAPDEVDVAAQAMKEEIALVEAQAHAERERIEFETKKQHWDVSKEIKGNKVSGASKAWVLEVIDASLVPREYLIVDEVALRTKMRATENKESLQIPGVRIFQESRLRAT